MVGRGGRALPMQSLALTLTSVVLVLTLSHASCIELKSRSGASNLPFCSLSCTAQGSQREQSQEGILGFTKGI